MGWAERLRPALEPGPETGTQLILPAAGIGVEGEGPVAASVAGGFKYGQ
jgi:hypothetical protein